MSLRGPRAMLGALLLASCAAAATAQTNDPLFRSWSLAPQPASPRSAALAGADRACPDDATAAEANPAALSVLDKNELLFAGRLQPAMQDPAADTRASRAAIAFVGATRRVGPRAAIGLYAAQPHSARISLGLPPLADGLRDDGDLETLVTEVGAAAAWRLSGLVHVGARVSARYLSLDGGYSREPAQGAANLRAGTSAHGAAPSAAVGLLLVPRRALRLGVFVDSGASWRVRRNATSPVLGVVLDGGSEYEVRAPTRLSAGVAFMPHPRVTARAQVDRVAWGEVQSRLTIAQGAYSRSEYELKDAWEPAVSAELSLPFRRLAVQLRAGGRREAPHRLRYLGADPVARASFAGDGRRRVVSAGAGLFLRGGLHADVALMRDEGTTVVVGAGVRF